MKRVTDWLVYFLVRLFLCLFQALSLETCYGLAKLMGALAYSIDRRHRAVALENLRKAFPGRYSESELEVLVREVYRHFATIVMEIAHIPRLFRDATWEKFIYLRDRNMMAGLFVQDRPLILVTGHFGNWEMGGYILGMFGFRLHGVARALDNPYLERLIRSFRTRTGQDIIYKRGAFDQVSAVLNAGFPIGMLADQNAGSRGVFVEFMGRPASAHKGPAMLAIKHDALICLSFARRVNWKFQYHVWTEKLIDPRDHLNEPDPVQSITQECARAMEAAIRQDPGQYFWLHRRWKTQPASASRAA